MSDRHLPSKTCGHGQGNPRNCPECHPELFRSNPHARWLREAAQRLASENRTALAHTCDQAADEIDALQLHRDNLLQAHEGRSDEHGAISHEFVAQDSKPEIDRIIKTVKTWPIESPPTGTYQNWIAKLVAEVEKLRFENTGLKHELGVLDDAPSDETSEQPSIPVCPGCRKPLHEVRQSSGSMLNSDQFDAVRAGDWYCDACPSNGRGNTAYAYFWNSELRASEKASDDHPCDPDCAACLAEVVESPEPGEVGKSVSAKLRRIAGDLADIAANPPMEMDSSAMARLASQLLALAGQVAIGERIDPHKAELQANDRLEYRRSLGLPGDGSENGLPQHNVTGESK